MSSLTSPSSSSNFGNQPGDLTTAEQFLKFRLHPDTKVMLPIKQITEVLKIQLGQIVPIPQMPAWVMGVYNWRGDILWMLDLGHLIGLDSWYQHQNLSNHTAIVLSPNRDRHNNGTNNIHLGLVVAGVEDLSSCDAGAIQSALGSTASDLKSKFSLGYWLDRSGEMVLALDGGAIASAMPTNVD